MRHVSFLLSLLLSVSAYAQVGRYDYDDGCRLAYQRYMALHLEEGQTYIAAEMKAHPDNLMAVYIADYHDCLLLLMNCEQAAYERCGVHFDQRLKKLESGDKSSPWYRFCLAGIYMHKAIVNTRFGEQYKAALNFRRSFSLLKENAQLFPGFEYNSVFLGLEQAAVGSLPGSYKWLLSVLGMDGDVRKGTDQLAAFVKTHNEEQPIYAEAALYYAFSRFYLSGEQQQAWDYINNPHFSNSDELLNTFVKATIALDYHKAGIAEETLQSASKNADYKKYPVFDYQQGLAMLSKLDTASVTYFSRYIQTTRSDVYIKDSWEKMALAWYVSNNIPKAVYCLAQVKTKGTARLDADKQAMRFAERNVWPLPKLMQARLLADGGYSAQALATLQNIDSTMLNGTADKAEYYYRLGSVYQSIADEQGGKDNSRLALNYYAQAIRVGSGIREQFAARAALQTGRIYEQIGMKKEAIDKYNECLRMPAHDFQNSIDQQAKAGINRLK